MERKTTKATVLNTDEAQGIVECIFSVFGVLDGGNDIVHNGAFTKTWNERGSKIKLLDSHNTGSVLSSLGKPLEFRELSRAELPQKIQDEHPEATGGAWAKVQFNMKTQAGHDSFWHIAHGDTDEWSFGYDAVDRDHSKIRYRGKEVTARNLRTLKQYELSPVIFGMNSVTTTTDAKSQPRDGWLCQECYDKLGSERECFTDLDFMSGKCAHCNEREGKHHLVSLPPVNKAGRVYSARNLEKIRTAYHSLRQALDEAGLLEEMTEEGEKDNGATGPQKSEVPPTSNEAGPAEDDSTRQIIELELQKLKLLEV